MPRVVVRRGAAMLPARSRSSPARPSRSRWIATTSNAWCRATLTPVAAHSTPVSTSASFTAPTATSSSSFFADPNWRNDAYGGDLSGPHAVLPRSRRGRARSLAQDRPLFFRASCVDGKGGAWQIEDTVALARELKLRGVDVVDCSSGGIEGPLRSRSCRAFPAITCPSPSAFVARPKSRPWRSG